MLFRVKGGVYAETSVYIKNHKIAELPKPSSVTVPFAFKPGTKLKRTAAVGTFCDKGRVIANAEVNGTVYPVRATISGKIGSMINVITPSGSHATAITVERVDESLNEQNSYRMNPAAKPMSISAESLAETANIAGVYGADSNVSLAEQIMLCNSKKTKIIVNCFDSDPFSESESRSAFENKDKLLQGCRILLNSLHATDCSIVADAKLKAMFEVLKSEIKDNEPIMLRKGRNKYPISQSRLVKALFNVRIPDGENGSRYGYFVINATDLIALTDAVVNGKPYTELVISVAGNAVRDPGNYIVPSGISVKSLLQLCGGPVGTVEKIVVGGAIKGNAIWDDSCPLFHGIGSVLYLNGNDARSYNSESKCIRCGRCAEVCPKGLVPVAIAKNVKSGAFADNIALGADKCTACGCCAYVCPGEEPLVQYINTAKGRLKRHV